MVNLIAFSERGLNLLSKNIYVKMLRVTSRKIQNFEPKKSGGKLQKFPGVLST